MLDQLQLDGGHVTVELPADQVLREDEGSTLVTTKRTLATIRVDRRGVGLEFRPALRFVVHVPAVGFLVEDVQWRSARYGFGGSVSADVDRVPAWFAVNAVTGVVDRRVKAAIEEFFRGLAFERSGYDPILDPQLRNNVERLRTRIKGAGGKTGGGTQFTLRGAGIRLRLSREMSHRGRTNGGVVVVAARPGTSVQVNAEVRGGGAADRLQTLVVARCQFEPPIRVESGGDVVAVRKINVHCEPAGVVFKVPRDGVTMERHGVGTAAGTVLGAIAGLVSTLAATGRGASTHDMVRGLGVGTEMIAEAAAGKLAREFTKAAAKLIEDIRPLLKRNAPLIEWDGLLCTPTGRPELPQPAHHLFP